MFNYKAVNHQTRVISWKRNDKQWWRDGEEEETSRDNQDIIPTGFVHC